MRILRLLRLLLRKNWEMGLCKNESICVCLCVTSAIEKELGNGSACKNKSIWLLIMCF